MFFDRAMFIMEYLIIQLAQNNRGHIVVKRLLVVRPYGILELLHHDDDFLQTFTVPHCGAVAGSPV